MELVLNPSIPTKNLCPISNTKVSLYPPLWVTWVTEIKSRGPWAGEAEMKEKRMDAYRHGRWHFRI